MTTPIISSMARSRPNTRRRAYTHEIVFDDGSFETVDDLHLEHYSHDLNFDIDTTVEDLLEINQADSRSNHPSGPRKVMMDATTWRSLSKQDQEAWDRVSEKGKAAILQYAVAKNDRVDRRDSRGRFQREPQRGDPRNPHQSRLGPNPNASRTAHVHDVMPSLPEHEPSEKPAIEASTHHVQDRKESTKDADLLQLASRSETTPGISFGNISHMLAPSSNKGVSFNPEVNVHELDRSSYETYSHEFEFEIDTDLQPRESVSEGSIQFDTDFFDDQPETATGTMPTTDEDLIQFDEPPQSLGIPLLQRPRWNLHSNMSERPLNPMLTRLTTQAFREYEQELLASSSSDQD